MRVIHFGKFYPPHRGGIETFLADLCEGLAGRDVQCEVVVSAEPGEMGGRIEHEVNLRRLTCLGVVKSVPICPDAPWALNRMEADIIHVHHPNPLADACLRVSKPRGRIVVTYHSDVVGHGMLGAMYERTIRRTLGMADAIVTASDEYVKSSSVLKLFYSKLRVIPYGIDCEESMGLRRPFGGVSREPRYLFLGRLVPYKGVSVFLRALRHVRGRAWIAGSGPLENALKREAGEVGVSDRVEFLGEVSEEEKRQRLAACDVFVLPSITRAEAFGIVLLEAMAARRPVVASDLPTGVRMLVRDGVNGRRFAPGDVQSLADALRDVISDPARAQRMGEAGARMVRTQYTTRRMVDDYLALYEELMASPHSRTRREERELSLAAKGAAR